jgi:phosphoserine aminotransferase
MTHRIHNFNPGPGTLPEEVLAEAREALLDYQGTGMGVMELSHRSKPYEEIHFGLMNGIKELLGAGDDWVVMLMQGGASTQFSMVPMNLMSGGRAAYVVTGEWSQKAVAEAQKHGTVEIAATTESEKFRRVPRPEEIHLADGVDYLHVTSNNTIYGTQWPGDPPAVAPLVVADVSSDFLSRPVDLGRYALLYAGAQKNLGPAGLTVAVARKELLARAPKSLPTMLNYRTYAEKDSLYNTPPTWPIYISYLCTQWQQRHGGLAGVGERNERKARLLYDALDAGGFYRPTAEKESRSRMNVTFRLADESQEERFAKEATAAGLVGLKGHRAVGGLRASIDNAMPIEGVEALVAFLRDFEQRAG